MVQNCKKKIPHNVQYSFSSYNQLYYSLKNYGYNQGKNVGCSYNFFHILNQADWTSIIWLLSVEMEEL